MAVEGRLASNVSSSTDFEVERRLVHDKVLPELRQLCVSLGLDLMLIDAYPRGAPATASTSNLLTTNGRASPDNTLDVQDDENEAEERCICDDPYILSLLLEELDAARNSCLGAFCVVSLQTAARAAARMMW